MKNKYIEVVKRWLAGEAISLKELGANADAAWAAAEAAVRAARAADAADAAFAADPDADDSEAAAYWVRRYEESTNDK